MVYFTKGPDPCLSLNHLYAGESTTSMLQSCDSTTHAHDTAHSVDSLVRIEDRARP